MKKLCIIFLLSIWVSAVFSQTPKTGKISDTTKTKSSKSSADAAKQKKATADSTKQIIRTAADLKTGTSQDVLASFFKLAYQNLSDGHHFQFNSSLFAIKAKTDTTLWIDTNYNKHPFLRNFVVGIDVGLDSTNKFKNSSFSVKYAIINNRDKNIFSFRSGGQQLDIYLKVANRLYARALTVYQSEKPKGSDFTTAANYLFPGKKHVRPKLDSVPKRIIKILDSLQKEQTYAEIKNFKAENLLDSLKNFYNTISGLMSQSSLWTVGGQISTNQSNLISNGSINTEFLKGVTNNKASMGIELDLKANLNFYDTTAAAHTYHRNVFSGSAGINWIIYKNKTSQKSYVEFKPSIVYNAVINGSLPGEANKFTGDGVLRFRITDSIWIPIDIKYDPKAGKVFGFLNITTNFDALGGSKSISNAGKN